MRGKRFDPPTIKFEGSTDDSIMDINLTIGSYGTNKLVQIHVYYMYVHVQARSNYVVGGTI